MNTSHLQEITRSDMVLANKVSNVMQIGQIKKCVISSTSTAFPLDQKKMISTLSALQLICGQRFQVTRAKQSIAAFKLREGFLIGCKSTLRKRLMWFFLEKCTAIILPRIRSLPDSFYNDKGTSLNFSLLNLLQFPELESDFELFEGVPPIQISLVYHGNSKKKETGKCRSFLSTLQIVGSHDHN